MADHESSVMNKLDARLILSLHGARTHRPAVDPISASVIFTGDLDPLRRCGFLAPSFVHHPVRDLNIAAGWIPFDRLLDLAALAQVLRIESGYSLRPEIDESIPEIGAKALHEGVGFIPPIKGERMVVGVIDTGFEIRHKSFRKEDGSTRIIALWDQTIGPPFPNAPPLPPPRRLEPGETSPLAPFNYGVEYNDEWIDGTFDLKPFLGPVRSTDKDNHGTPILGIAASNGRQAGNCHFAGHYIGVAPEADLILVKIDNGSDFRNSNDIQRAFEYIFEHPLVKGRPTVVNFSQGDNLGPHDGTSPLELAIDGVVLRQLGRAVVKSAGNEGASNRHAEVPVGIGQPEELTLHIQEDDTTQRFIEAWYPGDARIAVRVTAPVNPRRASQEVPAGGNEPEFVVNPTAPVGDQTTVSIISQLNVSPNGKNLVSISVTGTSIQSGPWGIRFRNTGAAATTVQVWLDRDGKTGTVFGNHVRTSRTITTPGSAQQVITVGAYQSKGVGLFRAGKGNLATFSSRGPLEPVPGVPARTAPDLVAPGVGITSAKNGDHETSCCECCVTAYKGEQDNTGTSIAAPHVAGVVALMLQRHPELTVARIRQILRDSADRPSQFTGPRTDDELNSFGFGRLNAVEALLRVPPFFPQPAPLAREPRAKPARPGRAGVAVRPRGSAVARPGEGAAAETFRAGCGIAAGFAPFRDALAVLRAQVLSSDEGRLCAVLVSRHFSEARALIRRNKRVAVTWHRATGPRFLRTLVGGLVWHDRESETRSVPADLPDGFHRFLALLARYGSASLRADIARHGDQFGSLIRLALDRLRIVDPAA